MSQSNLIKLIKIGIVLCVFCFTMVLVYKLVGRLMVESTNVSEPIADAKGVNAYHVSSEKKDGHYIIKFRNVIGNTRGDENMYYNLDVTLMTNSDEVNRKIMYNRTYAVNMMRDVISSFEWADVESAQGKEYLKVRIRTQFNSVYETEMIEGVYLEKFLYQTRSKENQ